MCEACMLHSRVFFFLQVLRWVVEIATQDILSKRCHGYDIMYCADNFSCAYSSKINNTVNTCQLLITLFLMAHRTTSLAGEWGKNAQQNKKKQKKTADTLDVRLIVTLPHCARQAVNATENKETIKKVPLHKILSQSHKHTSDFSSGHILVRTAFLKNMTPMDNLTEVR